MKKTIKRLTVLTVALFAFIGIGGIAAFASGRIYWNGEENYEGAVEDLEQLETRRIEIVNNLDDARKLIGDQNDLIDSQKTTISKKEDKITELEESITTGEIELAKIKTDVAAIVTNANGANGKGNKFDTLQTDVNNLAKHLGVSGRIKSTNGDEGYTGKSDQLKQAEEDMEDIKTKTGSLADEFDKVELIDIPAKDNPEDDNPEG